MKYIWLYIKYSFFGILFAIALQLVVFLFFLPYMTCFDIRGNCPTGREATGWTLYTAFLFVVILVLMPVCGYIGKQMVRDIREMF